MNEKEINEAYHDIRESMPPKVRAAVDEIIDSVVSELGESPEAWFGAATAINSFVTKPLLTGIAAETDEASMMQMIMLVTSQFLATPMVRGNMTLAAKNRAAAQGSPPNHSETGNEA